MADVSIPTTPSRGGLPWEVILPSIAGEAIASVGMAVRLDSAGKWVKADRDADDSYACIALNSAAASGDPINVVVRGFVTGFASLTIGAIYYLSNTAGRICPVADVSGNKVPIGVAITATTLLVDSSFAVQISANAVSIASPAQGEIIQYDAAWEVLPVGTLGQVLTSGGAAAVNSWAAAVNSAFPTGQTRGDIIYRNATVWARLAKGTEGQVLGIGADDPIWINAHTAAYPANQVQGDLTFMGAAATLTRLAVGADGTFLRANGAGADLSWQAPLQVMMASLNDATAGVGSTIFWTFDLPAGISATIVAVRFSATAVGAAGMTVDVLEDNVSILAAPMAGAVGEVVGTVNDTAIAAGATLTAKYTTGAATGTILNGNLTILLRLVDTN